VGRARRKNLAYWASVAVGEVLGVGGGVGPEPSVLIEAGLGFAVEVVFEVGFEAAGAVGKWFPLADNPRASGEVILIESVV
jgi:hypothetical protein